MAKKHILDCTCGGRCIWFDKRHPNALYTDIRKEPPGLDTKRYRFAVLPDMIQDFRKLDYPDRSFKLVVFDPPHLKNISMNSIIGKKYGSLQPETWQSDIKKGFEECWRVLDNFGVLVMKWSCTKQNIKSRDIPLKTMLKILPQKPLFGHTTGSKSNTNWLCFMKIPKE